MNKHYVLNDRKCYYLNCESKDVCVKCTGREDFCRKHLFNCSNCKIKIKYITDLGIKFQSKYTICTSCHKRTLFVLLFESVNDKLPNDIIRIIMNNIFKLKYPLICFKTLK